MLGRQTHTVFPIFEAAGRAFSGIRHQPALTIDRSCALHSSKLFLAPARRSSLVHATLHSDSRLFAPARGSLLPAARFSRSCSYPLPLFCSCSYPLLFAPVALLLPTGSPLRPARSRCPRTYVKVERRGDHMAAAHPLVAVAEEQPVAEPLRDAHAVEERLFRVRRRACTTRTTAQRRHGKAGECAEFISPAAYTAAPRNW